VSVAVVVAVVAVVVVVVVVAASSSLYRFSSHGGLGEDPAVLWPLTYCKSNKTFETFIFLKITKKTKTFIVSK